jgi:hypothetical protein
MIKNAFPEYDTATLPLIPATWEDISWRNDVCPSWQSNGYQIFVNFENPDDREYSGGERFLVSDITTNEVYLMTDDWNEVLTFVD